MPEPDEPFLTPLAAVVMREQYLTMRRAGFGRWEALFIVTVLVVLPRNEGSESDA